MSDPYEEEHAALMCRISEQILALSPASPDQANDLAASIDDLVLFRIQQALHVMKQSFRTIATARESTPTQGD